MYFDVPETPVDIPPITDDSNATYTYIGFGRVGLGTDKAAWKIMRVTKTDPQIIDFADGDQRYDNIWDNRASLNYSR